MAKSFAVYHTEKGNISSGGIGDHIDRKKGAEHSYKHADPERLNLNKTYILNDHCRKPLHQAISDRIGEGYKGNKAIRKDAVRYQTHILTGSHEKMKGIASDPEKLNQWINANGKWLANEFGKENIVRFSLHLDEKTPHIHAVTVPLTEDGRLSAKEILGNRKSMRDRQDRYAQAMKPFGLERGITGTGIKHEDAKEYYARMNQALDVDVTSLEVRRAVFGADLGLDKEKTIEKLKDAVKTQKTALTVKERELQKKTEQAEKSEGNFKKQKEHYLELKGMLQKTIVNPAYRQGMAANLGDQIAQKYQHEWKKQLIPYSVQNQTDQEILRDVQNRFENVAKNNKLSPEEKQLMLNSRELQNEARRIIAQREHYNNLSRKRDRGRGW